LRRRATPRRGLIQLGRLVYSMSVSLDGFVETPSRSLDWVMADEELHSFFNDEARAMSAFLYGRRMYADLRVRCRLSPVRDGRA
jgi:dihydrofolate reductase